MEFKVSAVALDGTRKQFKVIAPSEQAVRDGLAKKGYSQVEFEALQSESSVLGSTEGINRRPTVGNLAEVDNGSHTENRPNQKSQHVQPTEMRTAIGSPHNALNMTVIVVVGIIGITVVLAVLVLALVRPTAPLPVQYPVPITTPAQALATSAGLGEAGNQPPVKPVAQPPVPTAPGVAKPEWATDSGMDQYGAWADLQVDGVTQRFRWIQPGTFTMGSPQAEKDAALASVPNSKPEWFAPEVPHQVTLTQGFWLADSACTQALWQAITGANPSHFKHSPQKPVEQVSWDDCQQFLSTLNGRVSGGGFHLPSEAQWEYACRAGTTTAFSFGSTITPEQVNYDGNYPFGGAAKGLNRRQTVPVKSLPPNAWGLYGMHGNVWQWCNDWYGDFSGSAERDPTGPSSGSDRVLRGGSWYGIAAFCRSATRYWYLPDIRYHFVGFRFAAQATP